MRFFSHPHGPVSALNECFHDSEASKSRAIQCVLRSEGSNLSN